MKTSKRLYDIGIIGDLCSFDLTLAESLTRAGFRCTLSVKQDDISTRYVRPAGGEAQWDLKDLSVNHNGLAVARWARRCKLIISLTGALAFALRECWPVRHFLRLPPVINVITGSDIGELAVETSRRGSIYRQYLRYCVLNWIAPLGPAVRNVIRLRIANSVFLNFPYELPEAQDLLCDDSAPMRNPIRLFHASHLDWGAMDHGLGRTSTKSNDRFLRAFINAANSGLNAHCFILDRGPDRDLARKLICECGGEEYFTWLPHLTREELWHQFNLADLVVDQFDVGGLGGIAVEAMSSGKPVLTYIDEKLSKLLYDEPPPVINCRTEKEIGEALWRASDRDFLRSKGKVARDWAITHHRWDMCLDRFIFCYSILTGEDRFSAGVNSRRELAGSR